MSRTDLDAYVSIAHHWTAHRHLAHMPSDVATVLAVTDASATEVGRRLWRANHDAVNYGGPREHSDPELVAEVESVLADLAEMPEYEFQPLPGTPAPEVAVRRANYYQFQTANEYWDAAELWPDRTPPFERAFTEAVRWYGHVLLGTTRAERPPAYDRYRTSGELPDLKGWPRYDGAGWCLDEADRDLFLRQG